MSMSKYQWIGLYGTILQDPACFFSLEKYSQLVSGFEVSLNQSIFRFEDVLC